MIVYGHRGARGEAPENTLAGFRYGYDAGLRAFELDVRLTADNRLAVCHDASLARTCGMDALVSEMTSDQLSHVDARADFPDWPEPCGVPILDDLLADFPAGVRLEVEIKRDEPSRLERLCPLVAALIERFDIAERVVVTSFDAAALGIMQRIAPELARGFIGKYNTPADLETALALGCARACIPLATGSSEMVRLARAHGLFVTGWPGNTPDQLRTIAEWQVDGFTTDYPGVALPLVEMLDRT